MQRRLCNVGDPSGTGLGVHAIERQLALDPAPMAVPVRNLRPALPPKRHMGPLGTDALEPFLLAMHRDHSDDA